MKRTFDTISKNILYNNQTTTLFLLHKIISIFLMQ